MAVLAALVIITLGMAQAALRRANEELSERAEALAQSNELLAEQIEERTKAEEQLRQSQKMQALGQLTGGIAHDFNNLLTVIQGSADILSRDDLADDRRKRFAKAIVQAAENAAVLTSQLLAFARRQPLKPELVDLSQLVVGMTDLLDRTMGERIKMETSIDRTTPPVTVDRNQLQSAILNVASNARDAMSGGGTLRIALSSVTSESGDRTAAIAISDSGVGMDPGYCRAHFRTLLHDEEDGEGHGAGTQPGLWVRDAVGRRRRRRKRGRQRDDRHDSPAVQRERIRRDRERQTKRISPNSRPPKSSSSRTMRRSVISRRLCSANSAIR